MSERIFKFLSDDPLILEAYESARRTFKYFWREMSWERRRIIPATDMAMVKLPFTDGPRTDGKGEFEHMWVGEVDFDGETISGKLLNAPNWLTSVKKDEVVNMSFECLGDWMIVADEEAYGAFTVNAMRSRMSKSERKEHDEAWGIDFGDPKEARIELREKKSKGRLLSRLFGGKRSGEPEEFHDHPMCLNILSKYDAQLKEEPEIAQEPYEDGWTMLQREALAGNFALVKLFIKHGADVNARNPNGRTGAELARMIGWEEIAEYLETVKS